VMVKAPPMTGASCHTPPSLPRPRARAAMIIQKQY
jgi:hypothetical protein